LNMLETIKTIDMEIALANYFGVRQNLIVPNVSWGMDSHECDLFVLSPAGYGWEVEIKVSKADLFKDKYKRHGHHSSKIKFLYFAIPDYLQKWIFEIPLCAGVIIVRPNDNYECGYWCEKFRRPVVNTKYKYTDSESPGGGKINNGITVYIVINGNYEIWILLSKNLTQSVRLFYYWWFRCKGLLLGAGKEKKDKY